MDPQQWSHDGLTTDTKEFVPLGMKKYLCCVLIPSIILHNDLTESILYGEVRYLYFLCRSDSATEIALYLHLH